MNFLVNYGVIKKEIITLFGHDQIESRCKTQTLHILMSNLSAFPSNYGTLYHTYFELY